MVGLDHGLLESVGTERDLRAERLLRAAGDLLVAWGYQRITIGEVARRAGVGKGTVYLHFASKETLLLTVVTRAYVVMVDSFLRELEADPATVAPSRLARFNYRWLRGDPVLRALFTRDVELLGALAHGPVGDLHRLHDEVLAGYFEILRERDVARTDSALGLQRRGFTALLAGFLATDPASPNDPADTDAAAEMLAQMTRSAFEVTATPQSLSTAATQVQLLLHGVLDHLHSEIGKHVVS